MNAMAAHLTVHGARKSTDSSDQMMGVAWKTARMSRITQATTQLIKLLEQAAASRDAGIGRGGKPVAGLAKCRWHQVRP